MRRPPFRTIVAYLLALMTTVLLAGTLVAQGSADPAIRITRVDAENFPLVDVYVIGDAFDVSNDDLAFSVAEDGLERELVAGEVVTVGTQTALILDASGSILQEGVTGEPRYLEVGNAARRAARQATLAAETDWLAAFIPTETGEVEALTEWSRDHQAVADTLYTFRPADDPGATALFDQLFFALESFDEVPAAGNLQRSIVIFSDGLDVTSSLELNDAVSRAQDLNIRIHTVLLGPETDAGRRNLQRLATLTSGTYRQLDSTTALDDLWEAVAAGGDQRVLSYRSQLADPRQVSVEVTPEDGRRLADSAPFPVVSVLAPQISIVSPSAGTMIEREATAHDTPLTDIEPASIDVEIGFAWPDDNPREIERVEYVINDDTRLVTTPPFDRISFPIAELDSGNYTIRVRALDELGLIGESDPRPIRIDVIRPAAPAPETAAETVAEQPESTTVEPAPAAVPETVVVPGNPWPGRLGFLMGLISMLIGLYVLWFMFNQPDRFREITDVFAVKIKELTEPFFPDWSGKARVDDSARAYLIVEGGGGAMPRLLKVRDGNTRIGRDPGLSKITISNPHVSRLHCRISEEGDGAFRIWDEGSTSGTYVNHREVDMGGHVLEAGDLINLGPVQLRFQYELGTVAAESYEGEDEDWAAVPWGTDGDGNLVREDWDDSEDQTEPFIG